MTARCSARRAGSHVRFTIIASGNGVTLDLYEFEAYVVAKVPRADCPEHGVHQLPVPWADTKSSFTALFERLVISLLLETTILGASRLLRLSWSEVDTIMRRAVTRGLKRRAHRTLRRIGIDEKSVKNRHVYFTIVRSSAISRPAT